MIKNNESVVEITPRNIKYYNNKQYICNIGDFITVDISTMPKMSHNLVITICEICFTENTLMFSKYNRNKDRQGFYSCKKCSGHKRKVTVKNKYGVEYISQTEERRISACKWMTSDEFKATSKNTQIDKYGCLYVQTDDHREMISNITKERVNYLKEKGDYNCVLSQMGNKEKREKGMFDKYGATYSFNVPEIKEKIENTKNINRNIKIEQGYESIIDDTIYNSIEFKFYQNKVRYKTNLLRNRLFELWNGIDYYDGEFIKNNLTLHHNDGSYP